MKIYTALLSTSILLLALVSQASAEPPGLISYWKFDEGSGITATDSFGTHHGTLTNNPQWSADGQISGALLFGPDNYVDVAHSAEFDFGGGSDYFSIEAWIYRTADVPGVVANGFVAKANLSPYEGWGFATYWDGRLSFSGIGFWEVVTYAPNTVPLNEWTHVAVTRSNTGYQLYINGVSVPYYGGGGTWGNHCGSLRIGTDYINQFFWQGKIDEVAIFSRALSDLEVLDHYENGLRGPVANPPYMLVLNWQTGDIVAYDDSGNDLGIWVNTWPTCLRPAFTAWGPDGNLYVTCFESNTIHRYSKDGLDLGVFVSEGLSEPEGIAFDATGNLYVANYDFPGNIMRYDSNGNSMGVFATGLGSTREIAFDSQGNLYAIQSDPKQIWKISPDGTLTAFARTGIYPYGIEIDESGYLYVSLSWPNTGIQDRKSVV